MSLPIADLPVLPEDDSMLSRKFGREVANYFSGSPLNRVSFLRGDHAFLSSAFAHPTASFLLFDNLGPTAKDAKNLAYVGKADIVALTGSDPFKKTEEQWVKDFNSDITFPVVLFLGIDEKKTTGFEYKDYKGAPYFAVDVTPKGSITEVAKGVIEAVKAKGVTFLAGGRHMSLNAPEGKKTTPCQGSAMLILNQLPYMRKPEPCSTGMRETPSVVVVDSRPYP
jgi:NAD+ diphosphatase